ncbi:redoxin family protein [Sanyastnella coralliicola]|uniref:redoxin family protein n=1 Tax=Sanyastnella coralliicola TaxID=3069118 RepID=UPI0027B927F8|nr:redoxin family protein [Longitalea sp. SCSIO 12813]
MKKTLFIAAALVAAVVGSAFMVADAEMESLEIGAAAPMVKYEMTDVNGQQHSLTSLAQENGVLVVFSCNTCPFVVGRDGKSDGWEDRYNEVYGVAKEAGVGMVLVNSNEAKREGADSMEEMVSHAKSEGYMMPYVEDKNHQLADAFGARTTPHVFLFNKDMKLVYKGAIDDNVDSGKEVKEHYLMDALGQLKDGEEITVSSTKPLGCSIKRVDK